MSSQSAELSCTLYCYCVGEAMCFKPFTKHDENETRHDNEDEGDSSEEEGSQREWGVTFSMATFSVEMAAILNLCHMTIDIHH